MAEVNLPEGWCLSRITDIALKGEQRTPNDSEEFIYVDIGSINRDLKIIESPQKLIGGSAPSRARKVIKSGDVLVSLTRPNLNAVALVPEIFDDQIASTGFEVIKPLIVESRYIFAIARSKHFIDAISGAVQGALYPAAKSSDVQGYEFPLPSLAEQKVIAEKLDTLLAQVDNTKAHLEHIPEILKRFRQSVLAAAVSGKLTKGWISRYPNYYAEIDEEISLDPKLKKLDVLSIDETNQARTLFDNPDWDKWKLYPLELLVEAKRGVPYGIVQTGEARLEGIRTIRCGDVKPLAIDTRDLKLVSQEIEAQYSRTRLQGNEVILAIRGTVGNAAVITSDMVKQPLNISREVAMIPVRSNINPYFISFLLQSPGGYRCLAEKTKGVAQQGINLADVKRLVTPLPPLDEQTEIVRRVEELFAFADRIEQAARAALNRVNNLTQSILAKAFRGELTADWRAANPELIGGENSAEALLERIKAERAKVKTRKKA